MARQLDVACYLGRAMNLFLHEQISDHPNQGGADVDPVATGERNEATKVRRSGRHSGRSSGAGSKQGKPKVNRLIAY
ncbi:hypothetical protein BV133_2331 [Blastochloris viridis]|uniref:Uncharacterized protein n=1 Tax=Blastochloris viridis TaxID=1079 RepID=A0A182D3C9_BLAVI|nr:hypothetical protein BV133_2331 [Blastochloris viridis]